MNFSELSGINFSVPSDDEFHAMMKEKYDAVSFSYINNWPKEWVGISMPTQLVELTDDEINNYEKALEGEIELLQPLAEKLDRALGWDRKFIRLNSRSPKDATYPELPITLSGKTFVEWMVCSERCLDDIVMMKAAKVPVFICLRDVHHFHKEVEYRCFFNGKNVTIAQYHYDQLFPHLQNAVTRERIEREVINFFEKSIKPYGPKHPYVFDVYFYQGEWRLLEINPYGLSDPCAAINYENIERGGFYYIDQT